MEVLNAQLEGLPALTQLCFVIVIDIHIAMMLVMRNHVVGIPNYTSNHFKPVGPAGPTLVALG